jgi:Zn finger protein HypA/HybF involved in hydrogenase expression
MTPEERNTEVLALVRDLAAEGHTLEEAHQMAVDFVDGGGLTWINGDPFIIPTQAPVALCRECGLKLTEENSIGFGYCTGCQVDHLAAAWKDCTRRAA